VLEIKGMLAVLGVSVLALGVFALPAAANRIPSNLSATGSRRS
jgi:hypothetical protein